jgi:hypothetical protein
MKVYEKTDERSQANGGGSGSDGWQSFCDVRGIDAT